MAALDSIVNNMPVANATRRKQAQAATDFRLRQAVAAAPQGTSVNTVAPALGAGATQQVNQASVDQAKQNLNVNQQAGNQALQQKAADIGNKLQTLGREVNTHQLAGESEFAALDAEAKREMFDNRMVFAKDRAGHEFLNERQLQDYMVTHARDTEQYKNYVQKVEQGQAMKQQASKTALAKISAAMEFESRKSNQQKDNDLLQRLAQAKIDLENQIQEDANRAAARQQMYTTGGTLIGMVAGGVATGGSPVGIMAGGTAGGAAGNVAASKTT